MTKAKNSVPPKEPEVPETPDLSGQPVPETAPVVQTPPTDPVEASPICETCRGRGLVYAKEDPGPMPTEDCPDCDGVGGFARK